MDASQTDSSNAYFRYPIENGFERDPMHTAVVHNRRFFVFVIFSWNT